MLELEMCAEQTYAEIYDDERLAQNDGSLMFEMRDVILRQEEELKQAFSFDGLAGVFEAILDGILDVAVACPVNENTIRIVEQCYDINPNADWDKTDVVFIYPRDVILLMLAKSS